MTSINSADKSYFGVRRFTYVHFNLHRVYLFVWILRSRNVCENVGHEAKEGSKVATITLINTGSKTTFGGGPPRLTDGPTDIPSYRDAWTHLKIRY